MKTFPDIRAVGEAAKQAGNLIMGVFRMSDIGARLKPDQSPLTLADTAAHDSIMASLSLLDSTIPVISEEGVLDGAGSLVAKGERLWLVDPLDGTRDFVAKSLDFTVNIALMDEGRPVLGCVYAPATDRLYLAAEGMGAFFQAPNSAMQRVQTRPMDRDRFTALVSSWHRSNEREKLERAFPNAVIKRVGSSLKYAMIAAGDADIALRFTTTSIWDTAAAQCVIEQAGGALLDLQGNTLSYTHGGLENPSFFAVGDLGIDIAEWLDAVLNT